MDIRRLERDALNGDVEASNELFRILQRKDQLSRKDMRLIFNLDKKINLTINNSHYSISKHSPPGTWLLKLIKGGEGHWEMEGVENFSQKVSWNSKKERLYLDMVEKEVKTLLSGYSELEDFDLENFKNLREKIISLLEKYDSPSDIKKLGAFHAMLDLEGKEFYPRLGILQKGLNNLWHHSGIPLEEQRNKFNEILFKLLEVLIDED